MEGLIFFFGGGVVGSISVPLLLVLLPRITHDTTTKKRNFCLYEMGINMHMKLQNKSRCMSKLGRRYN